MVCVILLCFALQGCHGLRHLFVFCISGLRWSAFLILQFWVALVCVALCRSSALYYGVVFVVQSRTGVDFVVQSSTGVALCSTE